MVWYGMAWYGGLVHLALKRVQTNFFNFVIAVTSNSVTASPLLFYLSYLVPRSHWGGTMMDVEQWMIILTFERQRAYLLWLRFRDSILRALSISSGTLTNSLWLKSCESIKIRHIVWLAWEYQKSTDYWNNI